MGEDQFFGDKKDKNYNKTHIMAATTKIPKANLWKLYN